MRNTWTELSFNNKKPTDAELQSIEKDLESIDINEGFETENTKLTFISDEDVDKQMKNFSKKELKLIDEMLRVIEDPSYICSARKRRLAAKEELKESEEMGVAGISFDGNMGFGGIYDNYGNNDY